MSVIRLALYGTLGNIRYSTSLIRDTWECPSLVCHHMGHFGMYVIRLSLHSRSYTGHFVDVLTGEYHLVGCGI